MLLNNQWTTKEIKAEIKRYLETNDDGNVTIRSPWDAAKAGLREKLKQRDLSSGHKRKSQTNTWLWDSPCGPVVANPRAKRRGHGFNPWSGKIHMPQSN